MAKNNTYNFQKIASTALIVTGTSVASNILVNAVNMKDLKLKSVALMGVGLALPAIIKNESIDLVGNTLLAVGAYRLSDMYNIPGKIGLDSESAIYSGASN